LSSFPIVIGITFFSDGVRDGDLSLRAEFQMRMVAAGAAALTSGRVSRRL
jgi:hypothetical protein